MATEVKPTKIIKNKYILKEENWKHCKIYQSLPNFESIGIMEWSAQILVIVIDFSFFNINSQSRSTFLKKIQILSWSGFW